MDGSELRSALQKALGSASRADICVGYFNLGGWKLLTPHLKAKTSVLEPYRILIGMPPDSDRELRKDLLRGISSDTATLRSMAALLRERKVIVKISRRRQHSKLYLLYDSDRPVVGFLGSSNLTRSGLTSAGESNLALNSGDFPRYAAQFAEWWIDASNTDFTDHLATLIETRIAGYRPTPAPIPEPTSSYSHPRPSLESGPAREILTAFYHATGGPNWKNNTNWLSNRPIGEWYGVTTDYSGWVNGLRLRGNGLIGEISPQLGNCSKLEALDLSHNQLTGKVPPEISNLSKLKFLWIDRNSLRGEIPQELGRLSKLEVLDLSDNGLTGEVPCALGILCRLHVLYLGGNQLTGYVPARLLYVPYGDVSDLGLPFSGHPCFWRSPVGRLWVFCQGVIGGVIDRQSKHIPKGIQPSIPLCTIQRPPPSSLAQVSPPPSKVRFPPKPTDMPIPVSAPSMSENSSAEVSDRAALVALYNAMNGPNWKVKNNWLSDAPVDEWHGVGTDGDNRITRLFLADTKLSGEIPREIGQLSKLEVLFLSGDLRGEIPPEFGNLSELKFLTLLGGLRGVIPPALGNLSSLKSLDLADNRLNGDIPPELGNISNLEYLDLSKNRLKGEIPAELGRLTNLTELKLSENSLVGCIPHTLRDIPDNDFYEIGLPFSISDRDVLTALYDATGGANWRNNCNWLSNAPIGEWYGVTTNSEGKVTVLSLWDNGLTGEIPPQLELLPDLNVLLLWGNQLTGKIPPELGALTNLTTLNLADNQLSGEIPNELGKLVKREWTYPTLQRLYLAGNQLTGCVPEKLRSVENNDSWELDLPSCAVNSDRDALVALYKATDGLNWSSNRNWLTDAPIGQWYGVITDASGSVTGLRLVLNRLRGEIPPELGNLNKLVEIQLQANLLKGKIPPELGRLSKLQVLRLWQNGLSGEIPLELGNLTDLKELCLQNNLLNGKIPSELGNLANLTVLLLMDNQLRGEIPSTLGKLTNLTGLDLSGNYLSGKMPPELGNLTKLTKLILGEHHFLGEIPSELGNLTNLVRLDLGGNYLSGKIPSELGNLTSLESLNLSENRLSGELPSELGNLSKLKLLLLSDNQLIGYIPNDLQFVEYNDLRKLGLPFSGR